MLLLAVLAVDQLTLPKQAYLLIPHSYKLNINVMNVASFYVFIVFCASFAGKAEIYTVT